MRRSIQCAGAAGRGRERIRRGESPLELETRADSILESVGVLQVAHAVAKEQEDLRRPASRSRGSKCSTGTWMSSARRRCSATAHGDANSPDADTGGSGAEATPSDAGYTGRVGRPLDGVHAAARRTGPDFCRISKVGSAAAAAAESGRSASATCRRRKRCRSRNRRYTMSRSPPAETRFSIPRAQTPQAQSPLNASVDSKCPRMFAATCSRGFEQHIAPANAIHKSRRRSRAAH